MRHLRASADSLSRFSASGGLDAAFGAGGTVVTDVGGAVVEGVAVQGDGRILLLGAGDSAADQGAEDCTTLLVRYTSAGALDGGFGTGGVVKVDGTPGYETGAGVAMQPDDRIVVAGWAYPELPPSTRPRIVISRFLADGTPDPSFGSGGIDLLPAGIGNPAGGGDFATAVALRPDGRITVGGLVADQIDQPTAVDFALAVTRFGGSCGDAVVDAGEQCDDGNADGHDCCSAGCGSDPVGQSCNTADTRPCTWEVCDGAGTCQVGGSVPALPLRRRRARRRARDPAGHGVDREAVRKLDPRA